MLFFVNHVFVKEREMKRKKPAASSAVHFSKRKRERTKEEAPPPKKKQKPHSVYFSFVLALLLVSRGSASSHVPRQLVCRPSSSRRCQEQRAWKGKKEDGRKSIAFSPMPPSNLSPLALFLFNSPLSLSTPCSCAHSLTPLARIYSVLNSLGLYNKNAKILFLVREKKNEKHLFLLPPRSIGRRRGKNETAVPCLLAPFLSLLLPRPSRRDGRGLCVLEARDGWKLKGGQGDNEGQRERERERSGRKKEGETERPHRTLRSEARPLPSPPDLWPTLTSTSTTQRTASLPLPSPAPRPPSKTLKKHRASTTPARPR